MVTTCLSESTNPVRRSYHVTSGLTRDWSLRQDLWRENGSRNYLFFFSLQNLSSSLSTLRPCEGHGAASNLKGEGIIKLWKDTVLVVFTEEREQLRELCGNGGSNEEKKKWRQTWGSDMKFCEVEFFFLFFSLPRFSHLFFRLRHPLYGIRSVIQSGNKRFRIAVI